MSSKRQKRVAETSAEFEEAKARAAATKVVAARTNEELFVVDRTGSKSARRRITKEQVALVANVPVSKTERVLQRKLETGKLLKGRQASAKPAESALKDLWGTDEIQESAIMTKKVQKPSVVLSTAKKVAGPGFSYNPTPQAHQDALAEALALEIKKRERELRDRKPVNVMPVTRQEGEVNYSDDDDDDEDDDDGGADGISQSAKKAKMKEKKTRAQRNKERRRKDQEAERSVEQSEKRLLKDIEKLPALVQSIEKEERKVASLRLLRKVQAQSAVDETAMTYEEAGAVPLSDELSGTLRRVIPKGSGLSSTVTKFKSTGAIQFRDKFKRHKGDNLHTRKRVVWVARHKYP